MAHGRLVLGVSSGRQPHGLERVGEDRTGAPAKVLGFMEMLDLAFGAETFRDEGRRHRTPETHVARAASASPAAGW